MPDGAKQLFVVAGVTGKPESAGGRAEREQAGERGLEVAEEELAEPPVRVRVCMCACVCVCMCACVCACV